MVAGASFWACLRLHHSVAGDLLLVEPPTDKVSKASPHPAASAIGPFPWLRVTLEGRLRWRGRHPIDPAREVEQCELLDVQAVSIPPAAEALSLDRLLRAARERPAIGWGVPLRIVPLSASDGDQCRWLDPTAAQAFRQVAHREVLTLAWFAAVIDPGGLLRRARLTHLIPGLPVDAV